jgi:hypothetical protein
MLEVTDKMKLPKQNCDEIFEVVDVQKLVNEEIMLLPESTSIMEKLFTELGFKRGFNKSMELNKDKLFTIDDIDKAIEWATVNGRKGDITHYDIDNFIQSLQQPTEIEVEIEMICPQCQEWGYVSECRKDCNKKFLQPKLDSEGCLILKKI